MKIFPIRTAFGAAVWWASLASLAMLAWGLLCQSANAQTQSKWAGFGGLSRAESRRAVEPQSTKPGQPGQPGQPSQLNVIDRATARRTAMSRPGHYGSDFRSDEQSGERSQYRLGNEAAEMNFNSPDGRSGSHRQWPEQQAGYQQSDQRNYQNPAPQPGPFDFPDYARQGFSNQNRPIYSRGPTTQHETLAPEQNWETIDDSPGQFPMEHPGRRSDYAIQNPDNRTYDGMQPSSRRQVYEPDSNFNGSTNSYINDYDLTASGEPQPNQNFGTDYFPGANSHGRGYLQGGTSFQGSRFQNSPLTATERALELQQENEQLRVALKRSQGEVTDLTKNLESANKTNQRQDEEIREFADRTFRMRNEIQQLTQERDLATRQRLFAEQRFNEQLKDVENMLDGVLLNELSDK